MTDSPPDPFKRGSTSDKLMQHVVACVLILVAFGVGWIVGRSGESHVQASESQAALSARIERLQDPVELELIRGLQAGDDAADSSQLMMLIDKVFRPGDDDFAELYEYLSKARPSFTDSVSEFPRDPSGCEILYFDLMSIENEGAKSYYVVVDGTNIIAVIVGEYWTV
ncbi:MAG: hypothetical protein AAFU85_26505 [Planctomycetota bacterium]